MNKLGIWGIAIAGAFVVGILTANPVVEAVGGWKEAVANLQSQIDASDEIFTVEDTKDVPEGNTVTIELVCPENSASIRDGNSWEFISASSTDGLSTSVSSGVTLTVTVTNNLNLPDLQVTAQKVCADFS